MKQVREDGVNVVLDLAEFEPHLDLQGNLTITMPFIAVRWFEPTAVETIYEQLGEAVGTRVLDDAALLIHRALVANVLSKKMR